MVDRELTTEIALNTLRLNRERIKDLVFGYLLGELDEFELGSFLKQLYCAEQDALSDQHFLTLQNKIEARRFGLL